ncbi:gamma-glutamylcyclotransferase [Yoonia sediminilitoris]|uniref:glutathione-specific gamma-glutamylcyclotransferase n=1 Tax=Yoonia sediminilitoris TaxID=1286148 RepID=A0A2T6K9Z6_9RHOB|nr:gamma-glutamylcyclotransferase [Yoonia sediminilitoris]PUB11563.1 cation transport protein ChaC [Yoonia sediminilitoris]RCW91763.1 cation transport protein ChaC [Yoonia sediminilitoris]
MALWIFGYGSLLWNPGFTPVQTVKAQLQDYHRSFCMLSVHHRGTEENPGLVLALDASVGSKCTGLALRVHEGEEEQVLTYLRERELISSAYYETTVCLIADHGEAIEATTYIIDPDHRQYCQFDLEKQARMIAGAVGGRGPNTEYLYNTAAHLTELGIRDNDMAFLVERVRALTAT